MVATGRPWESTVKRCPFATCRSRVEKERLASDALTTPGWGDEPVPAKSVGVVDLTTLRADAVPQAQLGAQVAASNPQEPLGFKGGHQAPPPRGWPPERGIRAAAPDGPPRCWSGAPDRPERSGWATAPQRSASRAKRSRLASQASGAVINRSTSESGPASPRALEPNKRTSAAGINRRIAADHGIRSAARSPRRCH